MTTSDEYLMKIQEENWDLSEEVCNLKVANQALTEALDHFIKVAEFKANVSGTMGHLRDAYEHAIDAKARADKALCGA